MHFRHRERGAIDSGAHRAHARQPGQLRGARRPRRPVRQGELHDMLGTEGGDQGTGSAERYDLTMVHDGDPVAQALRFFHIVRGEEDRAARRPEAADHVPQLAARLRIEARRGLVEEQELRPGDERARHREALLLAARQLTHPRGALLLEPHQPEHFLHGMRGAVEAAKQPDGLFDRELVGELRVLQLNAQALAQRAAIRTPRPSHPEDLDLTPVGRGESLEDLDGGRLPRPVRPQQPKAFAYVDGEIEPRDRHDVRVALREAGTTDRQYGRGHGQAGFFGSGGVVACPRSEEHTSELQSLAYLVCRLLLEKKKTTRSRQAYRAFRTAPLWRSS